MKKADLPVKPHDSTVFQWLAKSYHTAANAFEQATNVSAARWRLLFIVDRQKSCTQKFLISQVQVDAGSITRQLKMLESEGLIHRENDPADARLTRVSLTAEGKAYVKDIYKRRAAFLERMLAGIPQKDLEVLVRSFERINSNLGDTTPLP